MMELENFLLLQECGSFDHLWRLVTEGTLS
jgi:hypothetical protein